MRISIRTLGGELTWEELLKLLQCVRDIEQQDPARTIVISVDAPTFKLDELNRVLDSLKPPLPHQLKFRKREPHEA